MNLPNFLSNLAQSIFSPQNIAVNAGLGAANLITKLVPGPVDDIAVGALTAANMADDVANVATMAANNADDLFRTIDLTKKAAKVADDVPNLLMNTLPGSDGILDDLVQQSKALMTNPVPKPTTDLMNFTDDVIDEFGFKVPDNLASRQSLQAQRIADRANPFSWRNDPTNPFNDFNEAAMKAGPRPVETNLSELNHRTNPFHTLNDPKNPFNRLNDPTNPFGRVQQGYQPTGIETQLDDMLQNVEDQLLEKRLNALRGAPSVGAIAPQTTGTTMSSAALTPQTTGTSVITPQTTGRSTTGLVSGQPNTSYASAEPNVLDRLGEKLDDVKQKLTPAGPEYQRLADTVPEPPSIITPQTTGRSTTGLISGETNAGYGSAEPNMLDRLGEKVDEVKQKLSSSGPAYQRLADDAPKVVEPVSGMTPQTTGNSTSGLLTNETKLDMYGGNERSLLDTARDKTRAIGKTVQTKIDEFNQYQPMDEIVDTYYQPGSRKRGLRQVFDDTRMAIRDYATGKVDNALMLDTLPPVAEIPDTASLFSADSISGPRQVQQQLVTSGGGNFMEGIVAGASLGGLLNNGGGNTYVSNNYYPFVPLERPRKKPKDTSIATAE